MAKLTEEMKAVFGKNKIFPVATASKSGVPNVAPIAFVQIVSDDTIWLGDNYMVKTLANVKENPWMAIEFWDPDTKRCFQVKGKVAVKTAGPDYEKVKAMIKQRTRSTLQSPSSSSPSPRSSNGSPSPQTLPRNSPGRCWALTMLITVPASDTPQRWPVWPSHSAAEQ
jgi:pyridoxine/pyridoxamine 5'-phosphate oxidase